MASEMAQAEAKQNHVQLVATRRPAVARVQYPQQSQVNRNRSMGKKIEN